VPKSLSLLKHAAKTYLGLSELLMTSCDPDILKKVGISFVIHFGGQSNFWDPYYKAFFIVTYPPVRCN